MPLRSVLVKDWMAANLVTLKPDMDVMDALARLVEARIAGAPVVDHHGNMVGMLSEFDCMKVALDSSYHGQWGGRVSEFMTRDVITVPADMSIIDLARRFQESRLRRFPVMDDTRLVGQISRRDVLRALMSIADGPRRA
ncbi:CBS domain-containing protein [Lentisalinibacter orientalis]|jgi:CBS domain-containing protein|uniref:CBS domain-containing protein n=1 Tax=Lentisalinibacter orientalis TaxID=2992241 RepID=UPI0038687263